MNTPKPKCMAVAALLATLALAAPVAAQEPSPTPAPAPAAAPKTLTLTSEGGKCGPGRELLLKNKEQIESLCPAGDKPKAEVNAQGCEQGEVISVRLTCSAPAADPAAAPVPAPAPAAGAATAEASGSAKVETRIKPSAPAPIVVKKVTTPIIITGAIAGVALATGVVFAIKAAGDNSSYKDQPNHDVALSGESSAFIADVSFGVAALFGLTAIALYFLPDEQQAPDPAAAPPPSAKARRILVPTVSSALKGELLRF